MSRIGKIRAYMFKMEIDPSSKNITRSYEDFKMHSCSTQDLPLFQKLGNFQDAMRVFRCIDDGQVINFMGDFTKDNQNLFAYDFVKCDKSNKTLNCYNDAELNVRLRDFGGYVLYST